MFRIDYDRAANCLAIHVTGFWRPEDVPPFSDALEAQCRAASAVSRHFATLIHSGDFPVQTNDVADLLTGVMVRCIGLTQGPVAIVVASQLNKLQVERTLVHPRVRAFLSAAEVRPWLESAPDGAVRRAG